MQIVACTAIRHKSEPTRRYVKAVPSRYSKRLTKDIEPPWVVRPMNATRFERMTLWISALLESHALPLRHASKVWISKVSWDTCGW
jgi:hypothetical protein